MDENSDSAMEFVSNSRTSLFTFPSFFFSPLLSITSLNHQKNISVQYSFANHSSESTSTNSFPIRICGRGDSSEEGERMDQTVVGLVQLILYRDEKEEVEEESKISLLEVRRNCLLFVLVTRKKFFRTKNYLCLHLNIDSSLPLSHPSNVGVHALNVLTEKSISP